jgi:hypothetical protein
MFSSGLFLVAESSLASVLGSFNFCLRLFFQPSLLNPFVKPNGSLKLGSADYVSSASECLNMTLRFAAHITIANAQANELTAATTRLRQGLDERAAAASVQSASAVCRATTVTWVRSLRD